MSIMISSLYDALKDAGAKDKLARIAAEEAAEYETKFSKIDNRLSSVEIKMTMLQWMLGINLALTAGILLKLLG